MKELTKGYPAKVIIMFALPIMMGNIFQQLYNVTDSKIVSIYINPDALAAVGATTMLVNTLIGLVNGLTQGLTISVARYFGAGNYVMLRKSVAGTMRITAIATIFLVIFGSVFLKDLLELLKTPSDIIQESVAYARIIILGMVFVGLYNMSSNILRALGDSKTPLICLIISVLINIPMDIIFIRFFNMGIKGTAYATVLAQAVCAIVSAGILFTRNKKVIPHKEELKYDKNLYRDMIPAGLSMALMGGIVNIGSLILQSAINGFGTIILTAHTAARRILDITMCIVYSIGFSMTTYVSQNYGAGRGDRIKQGVRHAIWIDTALTSVLLLATLQFGKNLVGWIASSSEEVIISSGVLYIYFGVTFFYVLGPLFILRCSLQGMGHKITPLVSSGLELLCKIVFAYLIVPALGYPGIAMTEPISWVIMTIPLIVMYMIAKKKELTDEITTNSLP